MPLAASPASFLFLVGYLMLAGGSFALVRPEMGLLLVPVPFLAIPLHLFARRMGDFAGVAHSRWQMRTIGLFLLLFLSLVVLFFVLGASFTDGQALDRLETIGNAYNSGKADLYASLENLWKVRELHIFTLGASIWVGLVLLWPLKRTFQGMMALAVGRTPKSLPHWCRWLALAAALAAQGGVLAWLLTRQA